MDSSSMRQLPLELWAEVGLHADVETVRTLRNVCQSFSSIFEDSSYKNLCKKTRVSMPPMFVSEIIDTSSCFTVDYLSLYHHDPFASDVGSFGTSVVESLSATHLDRHVDAKGRLRLDSVNVYEPCEGKRGTLEYTLELEKIGVPGWMLDIFHPRVSLTVRAYRMPDTDGDILVSAKLLRDGTAAVCRKEHQGWFLAGWQASDHAVEESVQMDFEVYGEGARVLYIQASSIGGGRLGDIEVHLHFGDVPPVDLEEQLARWRMINGEEEMEETCDKEIIVNEEEVTTDFQTSECRMILGIERNQLILRSEATVTLRRQSSASSSLSLQDEP